MISQIIFSLAFIAAVIFFTLQVRKIIRNINLGKDVNRSDRPQERWAIMVKVALGQSKMVVRPVAGIMHIFVYVGFVIINLEVLEIIIDGIFGTHRIFSFLGSFYNFLIGSFEILALLVLVGVLVFLARRLIIGLKRFSGVEMTAWPKSDALYILLIEVLLMSAFLTMNAADYKLQMLGYSHYINAGSFPISGFLIGLLPNSTSALEIIERSCWWFHILGILAFLNYLPFSKHFHIILAFPNTWYSNLNNKGKFTNMDSVTNEVKAMLDPSFTPPSTDAIGRFGAKDVQDLNWVQLMNSYSCTECGRCTSVCPANQTGKLLSPRKIMMDTRDRLEEVGDHKAKNGKDYDDGKSLLDDYISREEIWACTTCNACVEACPINIDPLSIIVDLRRYAVMEESNVTVSLNAMFSNVENNGAPWKYSPADRLNWAEKEN
ncbi:Fe-S oxidoreductase [Pedobacter psychrophilus]|uniref:Fe-S oxidoreductase n=1 Tax=Pedobacter psychrophilus TaxID=1826909 RepID=A0A179DHK6_9SPHI|nr:(Fe-S)-binding protein [Pedobacter psychrophilus]OAQ40556.1 Fe-S oxidoreductase [Pedobacter psychrophilus]